MKNIFIYKNKNANKTFIFVKQLNKDFCSKLNIKNYKAKLFFKKFFVKNSNSLFIMSRLVSISFLNKLAKEKIVSDKSVRILIVENSFESINLISSLINKNLKYTINSFSHFDYIVFKIDQNFNKKQLIQVEKIRKVLKNIIFINLKQNKDKKNSLNDRQNLENKVNKIIKNLILFNNIDLLNFSSLPSKAMIEPIRSCNLKCPSCPLGSGKAKNLSVLKFEDYKKIINKIHISVDDLSLFNYGEPLLHKDIHKMISYANSKGIAKTKIHTNGLLLTKEMSKKLIKSGLYSLSISVDAASSQSYDKYRIGGNFEILIKNIKNFIAIRKSLGSKKPLTRVQFIIMRHNESEIDDFYKMFKKIGVDEIRYKTFNAHMDGESNEYNLKFLPLNKKYSRYINNKADEVSGKFKKIICDWPLDSLVVNANGDIAPCCYDYNAEYKLGNIFNDNWWETPQRLKFRDDLLFHPEKIKICKYCAVGIPDLSYKKIKI